MNDPKIKALISSKMGGWDGKQARPFPKRRANTSAGRSKLAEDWEAWGRAVRRDILVLEYHLKKLGASEFYGDPGDPPPPPDEI